MKIEAFRFCAGRDGKEAELVQLDPVSLHGEKSCGDNLPLAYVVHNEDLLKTFEKELRGSFKRRGEKNKRKELSAYLLKCENIPFIQGGHTHAGQLTRSVRALLKKAEEKKDNNIYVIGAAPDIFDALRQRPQAIAAKRAKVESTHRAAGSKCRSPLMGLLREDYVSERLRRDLVGESEDIRLLRQLVVKAAKQDTTVLLLGETGSGKAIMAKSIHMESNRCEKTFMPVNCGAFPSELFESEVFGYKMGSHSGAKTDKVGLWKQANGGTLFLDEIADLATHHQVKILRALDEGEIWPIGAVEGEKVDARIIAATNRDLSSMVANGKFREDLYYRLRAFTITTFPLREHPDDIPLLADCLWKEMAGTTYELPDAIVTELQNHDWPGNVRDIKLTLQCLLGLFGRDNLRVKHLHAVMRILGRADARARGPLSKWAFDLHQVECLQHLRKAGDTVQAARVALRPMVAGKNADEARIPEMRSTLSNYLDELDRLCLRPLLFHRESTFDVVSQLKEQLSYFTDLLVAKRTEAMQFWKKQLSAQFKQASSDLFAGIDRLGGGVAS